MGTLPEFASRIARTTKDMKGVLAFVGHRFLAAEIAGSSAGESEVLKLAA